MTLYRVNITSLSDFAETVADLAEDWDDIMVECMIAALYNSGWLDAVWQRTPKSERARYISHHDASLLKVGTASDGSTKTTLKSDWKNRLLKLGLTQAEVDRLDEYGLKNLAKSLIPDGNLKGDGIYDIRRSRGSVELSIGSSVSYAARVHEAERPEEGDYWTPGQDHGWSARDTGNKYLERPYEEYQDRILTEFGRLLDDELKSRGLL